MMSNTGWTSVGELRDDAQDLAGRRLLLQRLDQVAVAGVELLEEPHVLDGDHRLVGEGLQQLDVADGKATRLAPGDDDCDRMGSPSRSIGTDRMLRQPPANVSRGIERVGEHVFDLVAPRGSRIARPEAWSAAVGRGGYTAAAPSSAPEDSCGGRRGAAALRRAVYGTRCARRIGSPRLATIVSKTGWTSVGELADHAQDLAGRRLLLQRSRPGRGCASSSLKSRTFSMAITAWSAKVSRSATCRSVKSCASVRRRR